MKHTNHLINQTSPYLLQHAHNPVNWYPWGEEALSLARKLNKPIFLSIGYSACHWCHVMEEESFENEDIASLLNDHFISIKVDREERPDIDNIYMNAVQMMTGSGGWPLSVWLTPQLKPFFGGTYFPPEDRWGRSGFSNVLQQIITVWKERNDELQKSAEEMTAQLANLDRLEAGTDEIDLNLWNIAFETANRSFDERYGGFGEAPKFPQAMELSFLLRYYFHTGEKSSLRMAEKSLQAMAWGGLYDQLGGGFHRYSTDERWLVPHFEKMLYDNALLSITYLEAFQLTQNPFYADVAVSTLNYILNEMTSSEGGFYSSQDADSEGEEGKFYVWDLSEIENLLDSELAEQFSDFYGVSREGNWEGVNILHQRRSYADVAKQYQIDEKELVKRLNTSKSALLTERSNRIRPLTDDKIITAWNAMMISAFCKAHQVLRDDKYLRAAEKAVEFILENQYINGTLRRSWRAGKGQIHGYLSDYALFVAALIDMYETTFEIGFLKKAVELNDVTLEKFWDAEGGGFYFTESGQSDLLLRTRNAYDSPIPSGNSAAVHNLARLSQYIDNRSFKDKAEKAFLLYSGKIAKNPFGFAHLLNAVDFFIGSEKEIVLSGPRDSADFEKMQSAVYMKYLPNKIIAHAEEQKSAEDHPLYPLIRGKQSDDQQVKIFICENYSCKAPLYSREEYLKFYDTLPKKPLKSN